MYRWEKIILFAGISLAVAGCFSAHVMEQDLF